MGWIYYYANLSYQPFIFWDWWHALCWGMMSATWCYIIDTFMQKIEELGE